MKNLVRVALISMSLTLIAPLAVFAQDNASGTAPSDPLPKTTTANAPSSAPDTAPYAADNLDYGRLGN
jgi:hypothetical protein